jgi:hypothetical protein
MRVREAMQDLRVGTGMSDRPIDLPDFTNPPVTEVVLGVQFNSIERFLAPHVGLFWQRLVPEFPDVEEAFVISHRTKARRIPEVVLG